MHFQERSGSQSCGAAFRKTCFSSKISPDPLPHWAIEIVSRELGGADDLADAFKDAALAGAQCLIFLTDSALFGRRKEIAELALTNRLPSIHSFEPEAEDGGFMSYGPNISDGYRRVAALADRVLKGANPANLPVEEPTTFKLVINLKPAKALGISVPATLLARADEVIE